ncbi:MAG TPA: hypothetical protein VEZ90_04980 [Blastocatellia bacterium]|nr:hypothetical protein [Blastocatellia bacterium]
MIRILTARSLGLIFSICMMMWLGSSQSAYAQMGGGGGGGMGGGMGSGSGSQSNMTNGMGGVMLLSGGASYRADGRCVQMSDAISIANQYMNLQGVTGLALDEVEEWDYNFYVVVKEASPSQYKAYQMIIDKWSGTVMPEPGPNMMWNLKYGKMMNNGMMGHPKHNGDFTMSVTPDQAVAAANQFLQQRFGPTHSYVVDGQPDTYYGYYTCDVKDAATGATIGMLSVNGSTGQVWYHTWHGNFIQRQELNP